MSKVFDEADRKLLASLFILALAGVSFVLSAAATAGLAYRLFVYLSGV